MFTRIFFNIRVFEIILIIISGVFMGTPYQNFAIIAKLILIIAFILMFIYFILFENYRVRYFNKTYLIILSFIPLIYAIRSNFIFGQSIYDGLKTNFIFLDYLVFVYLYYFFKFNNDKFLLLENSIIRLAILSFVILVPIKLILGDTEIIVQSFDSERDYIFNSYSFNSIFITWGAFIYLFKFRIKRKIIFLLISFLLFSFNIVFFNARIFSFFLLISLMTFFIGEKNSLNKFRFFFSLIFIVVGLLLTSVFNNQFGIFLIEKLNLFSSVFELSDYKNEDLSSRFRFIQFEESIEIISNYYFFGVGVLTDEVTKLNVSDYFYPSDLGLFGVIFNYGFFGLVIFSLQIKFFYQFIKNNKLIDSSLFMGSSLFLTFKYISSILTGSFVFKIGDVFLLLGILIFGYISVKTNSFSSVKL